ncbi:MAG: hypothetical protein QM760_02660 [Nibricoccus sp.]
MFRAAKDALAGKSARVYLNDLLARYGRLEDLRIDSKNGTMAIRCLLHGETAPLQIEIGKYVVEEKDGEQLLRISQCRCSREWVQESSQRFCREKIFSAAGLGCRCATLTAHCARQVPWRFAE